MTSEKQLKIVDEQLDYERIDVTPEQALIWLQDDPRPNRIVAQYKVNQHAREMLTGYWKFNGEPIRFNTNGQLLDGQHRLWAVVESKVTINFAIARNLENDTIFVTDVGKARNLSQLLSIMGETDTAKMASAITAHHRWTATSTYNVLGAGLRPTQQELLAVFKSHGQSLKKRLRQVARIKKNGSVGLWASIMVVLSGIDANDANDFLEKFITVEMLEASHPIMRLRKRVEASRTIRGIMTKEEQAPLILKAWNSYRRGQEVQVLSFRPGGATPDIYPVPI